MTDKKSQLGQFFTKKDSWLLPQSKDFIFSSKAAVIYDPFAGTEDLFTSLKELSKRIRRLDFRLARQYLKKLMR